MIESTYYLNYANTGQVLMRMVVSPALLLSLTASNSIKRAETLLML